MLFRSSAERSGETLQQFASLGMAAVGFEYDKTNQANFDAQFAVVLDELEKKKWAAKAQQTRNGKRGVGNKDPEHSTSNAQRSTSKEGQSAEVNELQGEWLNERSVPETANRKSEIVDCESNQPTPDPSQEGNRQLGAPANRKSQVVNHKLVAWAGNSLGAQRQLSFLLRRPERQPVALVRLNGGKVEELQGKTESRNAESGNGEHSTFNVQHSTSKEGQSDGVNGLNGEGLNEGSAAGTTNRKSEIVNHKSNGPTPNPSQEGNRRRSDNRV